LLITLDLSTIFDNLP